MWDGGGLYGFAQTWRNTANGVSGIAQAHNDALLCPDKVGEVEPRDLGPAAYMLANAQGKGRMRADSELRA